MKNQQGARSSGIQLGTKARSPEEPVQLSTQTHETAERSKNNYSTFFRVRPFCGGKEDMTTAPKATTHKPPYPTTRPANRNSNKKKKNARCNARATITHQPMFYGWWLGAGVAGRGDENTKRSRSLQDVRVRAASGRHERTPGHKFFRGRGTVSHIAVEKTRQQNLRY